MPKLLSGGVPLQGTTGSTAVFITLPTAQINLGTTPTTSTGYTLVTGPGGQLGFTSTLGGIYFKDSVIQSNTPNSDLTVQSTGSGRLNLNGNVFINGQTVNAGTATFIDLQITNLTVTGQAIFSSATDTTHFYGDILAHQDLIVNQQLTAYGNVTLNPNNGIVDIRPSGVGTVVIRPDSTGQIDNMIIGLHTPASGIFTDITATTLTVTSSTVLYDLTVTHEIHSTATFTGPVVIKNDVTVTNILYANTISGREVYDDGNRVLTSFEVITSDGLLGGKIVNASTNTITLINTGVLELFAGAGLSADRATGIVTISSTATLQTVTDLGNATTNAIYITNTSSSTTASNGALVVDGGVGVKKDIHVAGDVYSTGGSAEYNQLLYSPKVTVGTVAPINPRIGDFWIDSSIGVEFQSVPNGTSTVWVQFIGF